MKTLVILAFSLGVSLSASAGLLFNYSKLVTMDLDQVAGIVQSKIKESKKAGGDKTVPLKEALQAVMSRPDNDGTIEKVIAPLRAALEEKDAWDSSLKKLTKEALGALGNPKAFQPVVQVTYAIFLENVIAELKPRADQPFEKELLSQIRDAKVELTKDAVHERLKRVMQEAKSPSDLAAQVLQDSADKAAKASAEGASAASGDDQKPNLDPIKVKKDNDKP